MRGTRVNTCPGDCDDGVAEKLMQELGWTPFMADILAEQQRDVGMT
jgi:hypothetical protein